jgi:hypothetical protein
MSSVAGKGQARKHKCARLITPGPPKTAKYRPKPPCFRRSERGAGLQALNRREMAGEWQGNGRRVNTKYPLSTARGPPKTAKNRPKTPRFCDLFATQIPAPTSRVASAASWAMASALIQLTKAFTCGNRPLALG